MHRGGLRKLALDRLVEPMLELPHRIGGDILLVQALAAIIPAQVGDVQRRQRTLAWCRSSMSCILPATLIEGSGAVPQADGPRTIRDREALRVALRTRMTTMQHPSPSSKNPLQQGYLPSGNAV